MMRIFKYTLDTMSPSVTAPAVQWLSIAADGNERLGAYALVDDSLPSRRFDFRVVMTGEEIAEMNGYRFMGTARLGRGPEMVIMAHVFIREDDPAVIGRSR